MTKQTVLIIGSGGREHALVWALSRSPHVGKIYVAPGNAGTDIIGQNVPIPADNIPHLRQFAQENRVDLTIVGPEAPLAAGIVDKFQAVGLRVFGPTHAAAKLEASKAFSKALMQRQGIPTAAYETFTSYDAARRYIDKLTHPVVVKADGLAAGKGVIMCATREDAQAAIKEMMLDEAFGAAGTRVIIEEQLIGREVSVLAFTDGKTVAVMPPARDYKRVFDDDAGPNTGGMGAFAPVPDVDAALIAEIRDTVLQPAIDGMAEAGTPYVGVIYAGMMITADGARTLEFNCRFGDPETQVLLPLLETDFIEVAQACIDGTLSDLDIRWRAGACATVVLASPGYPGMYTRGLPITGLDATHDEDALVFHAGTARGTEDQLVTAGGRVLAVSGCGETLQAALDKAYATVDKIHFDRMHYRKDIGK